MGNAGYEVLNELPNVRNDLQDMCAALSGLSFRTTCLADLPTRHDTLAAARAFVAGLPRGAQAVVYYAGHAMQSGGENYLIPTATGSSAAQPVADLNQFVRLSELFQIIDGGNSSFQFIVLDACRDDPDAAAPVPAARTAAGRAALRNVLRSAGRFASYGIAAVRDAPRNTLVLFATGAGDTALDGEGERNGPLTKHLLVQLPRTQQVDELVKNVIQAVTTDTERRYGKRQSPALYGTFAGEFCFGACPERVTPEQLEQERRLARQRLDQERQSAAEAERQRREREESEQQRRRERVVVPTM